MKNKLILVWSIFLCTPGIFGQNIGEEQVAFDYLIEKIVSNNENCDKKVYFSGFTETEQNIKGPFVDCFVSDSSFKSFYFNQKKEPLGALEINYSNSAGVKFSKRPKKRKLEIQVYRAISKDEYSFVYISLYKQKEFVDHYLIRIEGGKVIDHCYRNEVI